MSRRRDPPSALSRAIANVRAIAALAGGAIAGTTVLGVVWFVRRHDRLSRPVRRTLGRIGIAWGVLFVVAVLWMHPRSRDAALAEPLHAGLVTYVVLILVTAVGSFPFAVLRLSRSGAE